MTEKEKQIEIPLSKNKLIGGVTFKDLFGSLLNTNLNFDKGEI